ncbi:MAG: TraR/DksA C4-type zinc finger protein [Opitutus sp.]|nr:TraR/DksA C4-type zinc finger protein [Opitutus sp.]MCS6246411.1 TraR/DksA C4-type zinc finger protein [Opitutus sp.]MCS6277955.1 TraR/DksA C4-type zinc finger protein [Opitutus sp.]MCS6298938.1 TraR/DksA C4-type zinc finger protein [Opitutus sp.]
MAKKAKKPTPTQKKMPAVKPQNTAKPAAKKPPAKPAPRVAPAKSAKSAKPAARATIAKTAKSAKPAAAAKSASRVAPTPAAKSAKNLKPVKPKKSAKTTKVAKPAPSPAPKKSATKPLALKSNAKTAVKTSKPAPVAKSAPKSAPEAKPAAKPAPLPKKPTPPPTPTVQKPLKPLVKSVETKDTGATKPMSTKSQALSDLRTRILQKKGPVRPIAFSLDEIREIAKTATKQEEELKAASTKVTNKTTKLLADDKLLKPSQPNHIKAASLADILGFNPKKKQVPVDESESIPEKYRRYYKLLIELRNHLTGQIDTHSEETLKRSSKDDAGDLSSYGQHMADAGTDTFDRDFALSLVSSEQEALSEVESAIKRIKDGTYGICENTQKPIAKERLVAVPFTRYSAEAQKDIEKNRMRSRSQAGLFGEMGEEGATLSPGSGGDGDDE